MVFYRRCRRLCNYHIYFMETSACYVLWNLQTSCLLPEILWVLQTVCQLKCRTIQRLKSENLLEHHWFNDLQCSISYIYRRLCRLICRVNQICTELLYQCQFCENFDKLQFHNLQMSGLCYWHLYQFIIKIYRRLHSKNSACNEHLFVKPKLCQNGGRRQISFKNSIQHPRNFFYQP